MGSLQQASLNYIAKYSACKVYRSIVKWITVNMAIYIFFFTIKLNVANLTTTSPLFSKP